MTANGTTKKGALTSALSDSVQMNLLEVHPAAMKVGLARLSLF